jgi:hypothetical protein
MPLSRRKIILVKYLLKKKIMQTSHRTMRSAGIKSRLDKALYDSDSEMVEIEKISKTSLFSKKICNIFSADYPEVMQEYGFER